MGERKAGQTTGKTTGRTRGNIYCQATNLIELIAELQPSSVLRNLYSTHAKLWNLGVHKLTLASKAPKTLDIVCYRCCKHTNKIC